jgi:hypothetical protein
MPKRKIQDILWPRGLVLYVESAGFGNSAQREGLWKGNWLVLLTPELKKKEIQANLIDGFQGGRLESPVWTEIFSDSR